MSTPTAASARDANRYRTPTISGLRDLLGEHVRDRPDASALVVIEDRLHVSYGSLSAMVGDMALQLGSAGLRPGDAVGLVGANTVEFVVALLGAARAGLVVAPLDPALPQSEQSDRLERLGAQAILLDPSAIGAAPGAQFTRTGCHSKTCRNGMYRAVDIPKEQKFMRCGPCWKTLLREVKYCSRYDSNSSSEFDPCLIQPFSLQRVSERGLEA